MRCGASTVPSSHSCTATHVIQAIRLERAAAASAERAYAVKGAEASVTACEEAHNKAQLALKHARMVSRWAWVARGRHCPVNMAALAGYAGKNGIALPTIRYW